MLAAMDEAIGQILAALDETGRRRNAFIFFCSDNGGPGPGRVTSNGPFRAGKGTLYEGGVRVVACAAWEGKIKPSSAVNAPIHIADLYPTLLKLAGAPLDQKLPLDGMDILPCLTEGKPSPRKEILHNITPSRGALRVDNWKLVVNGSATDIADDDEAPTKAKKKKKRAAPATAAAFELFNLDSDPSEKTNLADQNPEQLKELRVRYEELARQAVPPKNVKP
jgi:arylsulfatase A-like enzyme